MGAWPGRGCALRRSMIPADVLPMADGNPWHRIRRGPQPGKDRNGLPTTGSRSRDHAATPSLQACGTQSGFARRLSRRESAKGRSATHACRSGLAGHRLQICRKQMPIEICPACGGAFSFVYRFGSSLNRHTHNHRCARDGALESRNAGFDPIFPGRRAHTASDVARRSSRTGDGHRPAVAIGRAHARPADRLGRHEPADQFSGVRGGGPRRLRAGAPPACPGGAVLPHLAAGAAAHGARLKLVSDVRFEGSKNLVLDLGGATIARVVDSDWLS